MPSSPSFGATAPRPHGAYPRDTEDLLASSAAPGGKAGRWDPGRTVGFRVFTGPHGDRISETADAHARAQARPERRSALRAVDEDRQPVVPGPTAPDRQHDR